MEVLVVGILGTAAALLGLAARRVWRQRMTGSAFPMTAEDRLWLGRALVGETGGEDRRAAAAVAWSMANRYRQKAARAGWPTFTVLLRNYCQPINPKWESLASSGCVRRPDMCTQAQLLRRASMRNLQWDQLPPVTKQVVADLSEGRLENPVGDRNTFAANRTSALDLNIGGNWFGKD
jgi:hypothetical protein